MINKEKQIQNEIAFGLPAQIVIQNGVKGILWLDEDEFVPLDDVGLSRTLGYFRKSQFPDEPDVFES